MTAAAAPLTTHDCDVFVIDVPAEWQRVDGTDGIHAWAEPNLEEHLIVGGYHLAAPAGSEERAGYVEELVRLELDELARLGAGRIVVRRSRRDGDSAVMAIVTGIDGTNSLVFAYYFVVSASTVVKLKFQRVGLDVSERDVLVRAASFAITLKIREIHAED